LSYDLLAGDEKHLVDAHLERCVACRDFLQQTYGKEGALDELNWRAWRLMQRQRVQPNWWMAQRLRDLWLPFVLIMAAVGLAGLFLLTRAERDTVRIRRFAVSRAGVVDSSATPHIEPGASTLILKPDRKARAYVYEVRQGTMRRLLPPEGGVSPELVPEEARELALPPLEDRESRLVLVLVPQDAPGTTEEWDEALMTHLGKAKRPEDIATRGWPGGVRPALRYYP
jgi:hypothetical protein